MSFRLFIYYCALCGGWAAFLGWGLGLRLSPHTAIGRAGIRGMWLGLLIAFGLALVDSVWNLSLRRLPQISMRVGTSVLVGCVAGLLGGVLGQWLYSITLWEAFYVFGWTLTGMLVGSSVGVFELLSSLLMQRDFSGALKKLVKALIGGALGGLIGGTLSLLLKWVFDAAFQGRDVNELWGPTAWGFVVLGLCIGLLIGLAQVILKEAWIKVETGRRGPGDDLDEGADHDWASRGLRHRPFRRQPDRKTACLYPAGRQSVLCRRPENIGRDVCQRPTGGWPDAAAIGRQNSPWRQRAMFQGTGQTRIETLTCRM